MAGTTLADALQRQRDSDAARGAAARRHLEASGRSRELAHALAQLAMLDVMRDEGPSAATRTTIERARALAPGRDEYAFVHARVLAELGDFAAARNILGPMMTPAYPESIRSNAKSWMNNVVRMEAYKAERDQRLAAAAAAGAAPPAGSDRVVATEAVPILREVGPGEQRLKGTLERIDCPASPPATFHVRTDTGVEQLQAATLNDVEFITYRDDLRGGVSCGPVKAPMPVYVTWRAGKPGERIVIAVEFVRN